jgi:transcriptional regulator with XRE-family HTH domain
MTEKVIEGKGGLTFGERLRTARMERDISIDALARALGVTARQVARWQAGTSHPQLERLQEIARVLGVPPSYLIDGRADAAASPSPGERDGVVTKGA